MFGCQKKPALSADKADLGTATQRRFQPLTKIESRKCNRRGSPKNWNSCLQSHHRIGRCQSPIETFQNNANTHRKLTRKILDRSGCTAGCTAGRTAELATDSNTNTPWKFPIKACLGIENQMLRRWSTQSKPRREAEWDDNTGRARKRGKGIRRNGVNLKIT